VGLIGNSLTWLRSAKRERERETERERQRGRGKKIKFSREKTWERNGKKMFSQ
jgi:hypothetical protein